MTLMGVGRPIIGEWLVLETILAGIGISAAAGLNVFLPLIVLSLGDRVSETGLNGRFSSLSSTLSLILILLLMPIELLADKAPVFSHQLQSLRKLVGPIAGALAFAAINSIHHDLNTWIAAALGLAVGGSVSWWKAAARQRLVSSGKAASLPVVSMVEDACVLVVSIVSALAPIGNFVVLPLAAFIVWRSYARFAGSAKPVGLDTQRSSVGSGA